MKFIYSPLIFLLAASTVNAQSKTVSATVQDQTNKLLHYVFIRDSKSENITFSDSVGNFSIKTQPDSKLTFKLSGYRDTTIAADSIVQDGQIILTPDLHLPVDAEPLSVHTVYNPDGSLQIPNRKTNVTGSRYLSDTFLHGFFNTKNSEKIYSANYFYDYDKINGNVLISTNSRSVFSIPEDQIQSLTLVSSTDEIVNLEKVPAIDRFHFVQVLASGSKYSVYKYIKTKYIGANFQNVAMGQVSGQDHDEYDDEVTYYALDLTTKQLQEIKMKKSSIRKAFANDAQKVNEFMSKNSDSDPEKYVSGLVNYLNN